MAHRTVREDIKFHVWRSGGVPLKSEPMYIPMGREIYINYLDITLEDIGGTPISKQTLVNTQCITRTVLRELCEIASVSPRELAQFCVERVTLACMGVRV